MTPPKTTRTDTLCPYRSLFRSRSARFFEAQPLGMNTFPPRSASSATSPRSVKWQRAPAASRDWPRQDVGLVTADLTRRPAARLANSPTHLITELAPPQKPFAAAPPSNGMRQVKRPFPQSQRPAHT